MNSTPAPTDQRMRVYVVDDAKAIRERLVEMLAAVEGVTVVGETDTVAEATARILTDLPDAVVLDLKLADGNGLQVLSAVRARAPEIDVIVLTNHGEDHYRRACLRAGARYFFDKTTEFHRIPQVLRELMRLRGAGHPKPDRQLP
ncbi:MAG TPA: response regulator transcription factor [Burkholderiales bacterium]|nr:response regulator transcription factor [Burkholderiales bacterium]